METNVRHFPTFLKSKDGLLDMSLGLTFELDKTQKTLVLNSKELD